MRLSRRTTSGGGPHSSALRPLARSGGNKPRRAGVAALLVSTVAAALFAIPTSALAVEHKGINVNGVDITTAEDHTVKCGDGFAEYDPQTGILTLNNAEITQSTGAETTKSGIEAGRDMSLNVVLVGKNTMNAPLSTSSGSSAEPVFETAGDINISGTGSLEITSNEKGPTAIHAYNDLVIDGATVTVIANNTSAVSAQNGAVTVKGGAKVDAYAAGSQAYYAVSGKDEIVVSGEETHLEATIAEECAAIGYGSIFAESNLSVLDGAEVVANGYVYPRGDISIKSGGSLTAIDLVWNYGIYCVGKLSVDGGSLTAQSPGTGAIVVTGFDATGGNVDITGGTGSGLSCEGNVSISGGEVTFSSSGGYALYAVGTATLSEGTITMEGAPALSATKLSFGDNPVWYQWAVSPAGAVKAASIKPYDDDAHNSAYLRFEPAGSYELVVVGGEGGGTYAAGQEVAVSAEPFDAVGHFSSWSVSDPTGTGVIANVGVAETTFTMPAGDATLTANTEPHDFRNGACAVCGAKDPDYVPPAPSRPTYRPEIEETENGDVTVTPSRPHEGDEVTVAPEPDEGFEVAGVEVTDEGGGPVAVTDNGDGTWAFEMPAGGVTVTVTFACDGGALCPSAGLADVDQAQWYHGAVDWAVSTGALVGYDNGTFGPDEALTRAQMATVLWRLAGRLTGGAELPGDCDASGFYASAVSWALSEGVFNGHSDGTFEPDGPISREQVACVFYNRAEAAGEDVSARADLSGFADAGELSGWAREAMSWAVAEGVFRGAELPDGSRELQPGRALTRAEAAALLMRLSAE